MARLVAVGLATAVTAVGCGDPGESAVPEVIAFSDGDGSIYTIEPDGSGLRQVTETITENRDAYASFPSVSPDGTRIAYTRGSAIAVMNVDGSDQQVLADGGSQPAYSPDGSTIVFSSNRGPTDNSETYVMTAGGQDIRPLTTEFAVGAKFSPDGSRIVYTRGITEPRPGAQIWVMDADGNNARQLTSTSFIAQSPSWGGGQ